MFDQVPCGGANKSNGSVAFTFCQPKRPLVVPITRERCYFVRDRSRKDPNALPLSPNPLRPLSQRFATDSQRSPTLSPSSPFFPPPSVILQLPSVTLQLSSVSLLPLSVPLQLPSSA